MSCNRWLAAAVLLTIGSFVGWGTNVRAHDFTITETTALVRSDRSFQIEMVVDLDALLMGVGGDHDPVALATHIGGLSAAEVEPRIDRLAELFSRRVRLRVAGDQVPFVVTFPDRLEGLLDPARPSFLGVRARLSGVLPDGAESFTFFASRSFSTVHLTVFRHGHERVLSTVLQSGAESAPVPLAAALDQAESSSGAWLDTFALYLGLGFTHIVPLGLDHILFVLALFLLAREWRPLLIQITAFTVAHSVTLALAALGAIELPSSVVEPLIALSIATVAIENLWHRRLHAGRLALVFGFGLLHGLGFAGVLGELGLPEGQMLSALVAFNLGVELGQVAVVGAALLVLGAFRQRPWYRARVVVPASAAIAAVGLYWTVQRLL
jgi:hypothetical protein